MVESKRDKLITLANVIKDDEERIDIISVLESLNKDSKEFENNLNSIKNTILRIIKEEQK